jgi:hypothetical protein
VIIIWVVPFITLNWPIFVQVDMNIIQLDITLVDTIQHIVFDNINNTETSLVLPNAWNLSSEMCCIFLLRASEWLVVIL